MVEPRRSKSYQPNQLRILQKNYNNLRKYFLKYDNSKDIFKFPTFWKNSIKSYLLKKQFQLISYLLIISS